MASVMWIIIIIIMVLFYLSIQYYAVLKEILLCEAYLFIAIITLFF